MWKIDQEFLFSNILLILNSLNMFCFIFFNLPADESAKIGP